MKRFQTVVVILLAIIVASCSMIRQRDGNYYADDGPPLSTGPNPASVPNAQPRVEALSRIGNAPYTALGKRYHPMSSAKGYKVRGVASWYGRMFHGRQTSSGEVYDMYAMTAAHPTLPLPSYVRVKSLDNGREIIVRVNDRGPFLGGRIIDLSYMAARKLGMVARGTAKVQVSIISSGSADSKSQRSEATGVFLQAGSFRLPGNARILQRRLVAAGFKTTEVVRTSINNTIYYRVRVGPVRAGSAADGQVVKIRQLTGMMPRLQQQ